MLRTILGLTLRGRQTNSSIRQRCNVENINRWIKMRKKGLDENVDRINQDRLANICKNNKPYSKRPIEKSPKRWKDSTQSTTKETE
ncbi:hypothetical protein M0802_015503 [Mischocyttarus mexicanus]|nr:hypothetical protein M0802_015503 [Mischocyttarus mexicanus]